MASERLAFAGEIGRLGGHSELWKKARKEQICFCAAGKSVLVGFYEEPCACDFFELTSNETQDIGALAYNNRSVVTGKKRPEPDPQTAKVKLCQSVDDIRAPQ